MRTAWDIFGIILALLALTLPVVLGARSALVRWREVAGPPHPYANEPWFPQFRTETALSSRLRWEPFVYWQRRAFSGRWINVDSAGYRVTPQPVAAGAARREVWFFGGSTIWGDGARDSATIPAVVASALAARGVAGVRVRNYGEGGYVSSQELLRLLLDVRAGGHPDLVVFYDGINDVYSSAMNGRCGLPQNETRRQLEFTLGRFLSARNGVEFRELIRASRERLARSSEVPLRLWLTTELDALGHGIAGCYAGNARVIEALARAYGFRTLYFWQPAPSTSPRPLTPYERWAIDSASVDGPRPWLWFLNRVAARDVDSVMTPVAPGRFHNLATLFTADTGAVWLDFIGHMTERANAIVALAMVEPIVAQLR